MAKKVLHLFTKTGKAYWREIFAVLLLLTGIFFFRSERKELESLQHQLGEADRLWLWIGIAITGLYILLQAGMYVSSFKAVGSRISWPQSIELFLKRNFLSVFLPAGGISSLAYSPSSIRKSGLSKLQVHQASAIYGFVGLLTVFIVGVPVLVYSFIRTKTLHSSHLSLWIVLGVLILFLGLFRAIRKKGKFYHWLLQKFPRLVPRMNELFAVNMSRRYFTVTILLSLLVEFCGIVHLFIAAKALGLHASFIACAIAYTISVLLMIASPFLRGLGAVELSMVYVLSLYGFPPVSALAMTLLYRFFEFWLPLVAGFVSYLWMGRHIFARVFPAFLVFSLGIVNILSVVTPPITSRLTLLHRFLPLDSIYTTNVLMLLVGLLLLIISASLIRGHRNAWILAVVLTVLSLFGNLFKALDYEEAILAGSVLLVLLLSMKQYRLKTSQRHLQLGLKTGLFIFLAVLFFGFISFYFIDKRHFGTEFTWQQSIYYSVKFFLLFDDNDIRAISRFGHEFILLANILGFIAWSFLIYSLLRSYFNAGSGHNEAREKALVMLDKYGDSPVDYFKTTRDKLFFFSENFDAFIAYRVANGFAVVLEEPVCAPEDKIPVLKEFDRQCKKMGLRAAYYRVDETGISYFSELKKRKLLIGQEALLELAQFSLEGRDKKSLRNALNSLQKKGYQTSIAAAPLQKEFIQEMQVVSDEWLEHYDKKEMGFSQGIFDPHQLINQDVISVRDASGRLVAFLTIIPDFAPEECTYDLIRKTADAPGGCMDALIIELIKYAREKELRYLNLGLVPMAGTDQPDNTAERIIRYAYEKIKRFRHYAGLREFKEKYATTWTNKYLVYENDFDLLQLPGAINKVMQPNTR